MHTHYHESTVSIACTLLLQPRSHGAWRVAYYGPFFAPSAHINMQYISIIITCAHCVLGMAPRPRYLGFGYTCTLINNHSQITLPTLVPKCTHMISCACDVHIAAASVRLCSMHSTQPVTPSLLCLPRCTCEVFIRIYWSFRRF